MIKKILITGAAGFIGSHLAEKIYTKYKNCSFILYDKITYAANISYIKKLIKKKMSNLLKMIC